MPAGSRIKLTVCKNEYALLEPLGASGEAPLNAFYLQCIGRFQRAQCSSQENCEPPQAARFPALKDGIDREDKGILSQREGGAQAFEILCHIEQVLELCSEMKPRVGLHIRVDGQRPESRALLIYARSLRVLVFP